MPTHFELPKIKTYYFLDNLQISNYFNPITVEDGFDSNGLCLVRKQNPGTLLRQEALWLATGRNGVLGFAGFRKDAPRLAAGCFTVWKISSGRD